MKMYFIIYAQRKIVCNTDIKTEWNKKKIKKYLAVNKYLKYKYKFTGYAII